jgi:predicted small lipoprotein YifL
MRAVTLVCSLILICMLSGCGAKNPDTADPAARNAPSGDATAEQVAEEAREDLDCPADIDTPARAANAPVDDVVGVRPGLSFEEAANSVLCSGELLVVDTDTSARFNIKTYGATIRQGFTARDAEARVTKTSEQYMREMSDNFAARSGNAVRQDMRPGQAKWYVSTMGLPGKERVIGVAREEWFVEGRNPTMESVAAALIKKYGEPTRKQVMPQQVYITWVHDPSGRFASETSPLANRCNASPDPDGGTSFSPDCGVVVAARVQPARENPALAQFVQVGLADQAGGYQTIMDTEQALESAEMQRRAQQVTDAARNADQPQL